MFRNGSRSLAFRLIAGAALWCVAGLVAGGFVLSSLFSEYVERSFDSRLIVLLESLVAASDIDSDGRLDINAVLGEARFEQPYSGWYWQVSQPSRTPDSGQPASLESDKNVSAANSVLSEPLRSRSLWDGTLPELAKDSDSTMRSLNAHGPDGQTLRVIAREITLDGVDVALEFAVAGDRAEITADIARFNSTLTWSLGLLGAGLVLAMFLQVRFGLQPLGRIQAALADIRSGRDDHLRGPFPSEIEPLADEVNALLEHNSAVVERARTHVGNLAHALKTPLSVLLNESRSDGNSRQETDRADSARAARPRSKKGRSCVCRGSHDENVRSQIRIPGRAPRVALSRSDPAPGWRAQGRHPDEADEQRGRWTARPTARRESRRRSRTQTDTCDFPDPHVVGVTEVEVDAAAGVRANPQVPRAVQVGGEARAAVADVQADARPGGAKAVRRRKHRVSRNGVDVAELIDHSDSVVVSVDEVNLTGVQPRRERPVDHRRAAVPVVAAEAGEVVVMDAGRDRPRTGADQRNDLTGVDRDPRDRPRSGAVQVDRSKAVVVAVRDDHEPVRGHVDVDRIAQLRERRGSAVARKTLVPWTDEMISMAWKHENIFIGADAYAPKHWPRQLVHYVNTYGREKVLFGTDWPVIDPERAVAEIAELGLRPDAQALLMRGNALRVFRLPDSPGATA